MVLQTGLVALLTRLGAGDDIPIGSPTAGRTDQALEELVGFFINTLVLRINTSDNPTIENLLSRVRTTCLNAYANQVLPFERLVEELNPVRSMSRHPLFQVMLAFRHTSGCKFQVPGLITCFEPVRTSSTKFDLTFILSEHRRQDGTPEGISGSIEYRTDLFDRWRIEQMSRQYVRLLEAVAANPEQRIGEIDLLDDAERRQILEEWNDTAQEVADATLPELFEAQVERDTGRRSGGV